MLPNFLIVGAAKSGTTSLWRYLQAHPEISMPDRKELDFFCEPDWRQRLSWYESQFENSVPLRGEASVYYTMFPFKPNAAAAIREAIPDAKLIYLVRDPVRRAVAHYVQNVAVGYEKRPIDEAFADFDSETNEYVCASRYASQLREYLRHFPNEQILVGDQHEFLTRRKEFLRQVFDFLGADPEFDSERFGELQKTRANLRRGPTRFGWWLRSTRAGRALRGGPTWISDPVRNAARVVFDRKVDPFPTLDPSIAARVSDILRPEVEELREMTGLALSSWTLTQGDSRP